MAYYLDSSFDLGVYQPSSNLDDSSSFLGAGDFDLDAAIFSDPGPIPTRTTGPAGASSSSSNYTHFADPLQSLGGPTPLNSSTSSSSFPLFDPDSPFTASAGSPYPIRSLTRDGRLKTKLMGIGSDGGFLTSPLIVGNPRVDSRTGRVAAPEIAIESPVPPVGMAPQSSLMTPADSFNGSERTGRTAPSEMAPSLSMGSTASSTGFMTEGGPAASASMSASSSRMGAPPHIAVSSEPTGLGMGISGMPDLQASMELGGGFANEDAALRSFGMSRAPATSQQGYATPSSYEATPRHARSVTHGGPPPRFVEYSHVPQSHPPPPPPQLPATGHRPTRTLPSRTINKAKSCSALSVSAREQARATPHAYEPLTPVSAHQASFSHDATAPYSGEITIAQTANHGLLSFSDLYNFDGAAQIGDNVKQDGLGFDGVVDLSGIGIASTGPNLLAAPRYGPPSAASSPSTPYLSDPSPDNGLNYQSLDELSSTAMLAAASVESSYTAHSGPVDVGRQRSMYAPSSRPYEDEGELVDPNMLSPQHQPRQRQLSMNAAYGQGARNYSYPTRYAAPNEPMQWSSSAQGQPQHAPPPMPPIPSTPRHRAHPNPNHYRAHTGPAASRIVDYAMPPMQANVFVSNDMQDEYDRKMAQFDSLYDPLAEQPQLQSHAKRARDDEYYDSMEPIPTSPELEEAGTRTTKRLRTVASAPCLPARRLRPGPRPKTNKSPAEQHQSVFSATLSPPVPQIRRATSPFSSPLMSDDDEGGRFPDRDANGNPATAATITYVPGPPALPGQPRSSVPKDVIQSLYSGIPSHTTPQGVKVPKRYVCLIEGCERGFPRKSAIESHIQTHLEDKPFVCPHDDCGASFVRQHDLRRHERIHSGNKPFPCPCGKGFARGDALARHRARGICSGAAPLGRR
ncbi:Metallothionein expression activator [Rhodotorula kratochvilovae]